jgi:hypothetical protein
MDGINQQKKPRAASGAVTMPVTLLPTKQLSPGEENLAGIALSVEAV